MTTVDTAPRFSAGEAAALCSRFYGISGEAIELPSERDQNFKISSSDGSWVLKIANPAEDQEKIELENRVMHHLNSAGERQICPTIVQSRQGNDIQTVTDLQGKAFRVRLITFLDGKPLGEVRPHSPELLADLGRFTGHLVRSFARFDNTRGPDDFIWDMRNGVHTVETYRIHIDDAGKQQQLDHFLAVFAHHAAPLLPRLATGLVHNDGNDYNIIVGPPSGGEDGFGSRRVAGIIDFGDMANSYILADLAVVCAYAMLSKDDPLQAASTIVSGYHQVQPLGDDDLSALYGLICMRLIMSVSIAAIQRKLSPENEYLAISEQPVWDLLERLRGLHPEHAAAIFRDACGMPPVPSHDRIVAWLQQQQNSFGPVVKGGLKREEYTVFDLGIGSTMIDHPGRLADTGAFTRLLFGRIEAAGCRAGIGRYGEARLVYTAPQFREGGVRPGAARTVHLGIDIFMIPSTPVLAPLDGVVFSVHNNNRPLDYGPTLILEHETGGGDRFYTLYGHLAEDCLTLMEKGMKVRRGDRIAAIGSCPANGGWPPHLHFQIMTTMLGMSGDFPGVAVPGHRRVWQQICPDPNLILNLDPGALSEHALDPDRIEALRSRHIGPSLGVSYRKHLKIERGYMQYLYDHEGRMFLDSVNNVPHVGHSNPRVVEAAARQLAVLNTNTRYLHDNLVVYAERLTRLLPDQLSVCYIVNSGSEANDLALRLARHYTGERDVIAVDGAYHGHLASLIEISSYKYDGPGGFGMPEHTQKAVMPDLYQGEWRCGDREAGRKYAEDVERAVRDITAKNRKPAAFIVEPLMGCGGQIVLPNRYLMHAFAYVRKAGGLCIADEVQIGFGRVGGAFWGFETQGVIPDIVTMGKPIGNGFPLAAVVTTREIADAFNNGMEYFNTYGGNPVACAAGLAVLDEIEEKQLQKNALEVGNRILDGLRALQRDYPLIGDVRGMGLYIGAELVTDPFQRTPAPLQAACIAERMREEGILISTDGPRHNVLKIKPPIIYTAANGDRLVETLGRILDEDAVQI
ncbi:aminotransferase class III-fold pyridoxal phosphate-dependent enzyme [bacterium]|nr:aminotransferase class III-fold pyridoxal phosphate-dependent enzyme [bacterium]